MSGVAISGAFSPLQESVRTGLRFTDLQMGMLQGLSAAIPIVVLSIPVGRLTDRVNRVRVLIVVEAVACIGALGTAFADSFVLLFVARILASIGLVCGLPVAVSIAADLSTRERRGRALLLLVLGRSVGAALAFLLGGWLFGVLKHGVGPALLFGLEPWRAVNLLFAFGGLAVVAVLCLLREPSRREVGSSARLAFAPAMADLWQRRRFLLPLFAGHVSVLMADTAASIWAAPVLSRNFGLQPEQFGTAMGVVVFLTGAIGAVVGGTVVDLVQRSGNRHRFLLGALIASASGVPAALFAIAATPTLFFVLLFMLLFCGAITAMTTTTAIAIFIPNQLRGTCMSALIVISGIVSFGLAPTLVSVISTALGGPAHLGQALALVGCAAGLVSTIGFAIASRRVPTLPNASGTIPAH